MQTPIIDWDLEAAVDASRLPTSPTGQSSMPPYRAVPMRPVVSFIIPAYNEANRLPKSLPQVKAFLDAIRPTCEVIVVDDGSVDGTEGIVRAAMEYMPQLRLVRGPHKGKGGAIRAGVYASRGHFVAIADADLAMPIQNFTRFDAEVFASADIAIGSRHVRGSKTINESIRRRLMGRIFNLFVQSVLLPGLHDTQCGFKVLRQHIAVELCDYQVTDGWAFDVEWLAIARQRGYRIHETPVTVVFDNADSRVNPVRDSLAMLRDIWRIRRNVRRGAHRIQPELQRSTEYDSASVLFELDGSQLRQRGERPGATDMVDGVDLYEEVGRGATPPTRMIIPGPLDGAPTQRMRSVSRRDSSTVAPPRVPRSRGSSPSEDTSQEALDGGSARSQSWGIALARRLVSYLSVGGVSALSNLMALWLLLHHVAIPGDARIRYLIAVIVANEVSTVVNFIPNDLITFRKLPGHSRHWLVRFVRFHVTALGGLLVTTVISQMLFEVGLPGLLPQMVAIVVALGFNFTAHHLFTYREVATASQRPKRLTDAPDNAAGVGDVGDVSQQEAGGSQQMFQSATLAAGVSTLEDTHKVARTGQRDSAGARSFHKDDWPSDNALKRIVDRWILLIYIVFFLLIYSPALLLTYGYADDYAVLASFERGGSAVNGILSAMLLGGRPTYALLTDVFYSNAQQMSDLQVIRCVGVVSIGVLAWVFYQTFSKVGARWPLAIIAPVLICVTPPFQLAASWTALSFYPLAAIFAGIAALLVDRIPGSARRPATGLFLAALALEILAIGLYQPAAMMLWVFAAIYLVMRTYTPREFIWRTALFGAVGVIASGVDFLEIKLLPHLGMQSSELARTALTTNLKAKAVWFALHPLASALNVWSLQPSFALGLGVAVFSALGVVLYVSGNWQVKALKLAALIAFIPASYLPNLAVADQSGPFRTQFALVSLVVVCLCLACVGYMRIAQRYLVRARSWRVFERGIVMAGLAISLVLSGLACSNVMLDIVIPEYTESSMIQSQVRGIDLSSTQAIYVRMSCLSDSAAPIARFDEIGFPSSSISWAVQPMLAVELHEVNPAYDSIQIITEGPTASFTVPAGSTVVNARQLQRYQSHQPWTYGPLPQC